MGIGFLKEKYGIPLESGQVRADVLPLGLKRSFDKTCVLDLPGIGQPLGSVIFDRSGYNNHGTITGATWTRLPSGLWWLTGGAAKYVTVANATSIQNLATWTLGAWVRSTAATLYYAQIFNKADNKLGYGTGENNLHIRVFRVYATTAAVSESNESLTQNIPALVVATLNTSKVLSIYINGVEATYGEQTAGVGTLTTDAGVLYIGTRTVAADRPWLGQYGLPFWSTTVWTLAQVKSWYNQTRYLFQ